ncbi:Uveal autoantigen with coiled-coil domains and ankyrin repeats protein [Galemys pyrenaicus]|uniref:Uveal autoantigen with coiled-coil domains and ankyrin repeats protein n=1 Tax=Galemys pyrenaicus TaxID=202257 RepID=A0A8J5ZW92_GALPY|nr:Uveal autoantigen with coiled-coil domains and ankyrin repeats protein [Galemys pyrenaicus]
MKTLKFRLRKQDAPGPLSPGATSVAVASTEHAQAFFEEHCVEVQERPLDRKVESGCVWCLEQSCEEPSADRYLSPRHLKYLSLIKSLIARGPHATDWNKYDDRLMKAAERGDAEKVSSILAKKGVNPGKLDVEGRSAFHVVASKGNLECLNAILSHGVDITSCDTAGMFASGRNALHLAAKYGHALCLQKLLQYSCPTEHTDLQGRTALHDAAMADCPSSIQLLCDHGASVNAKDIDGRTPLVLATQMCRPNICQMLIDRGADINSSDKQNRTALMLGCEYGCRDAVEVLIKNGADITLLDDFGKDCSYYARIGDNLDILTLLKPAPENANKGREMDEKQVSMYHHEILSRKAEQDLEIQRERAGPVLEDSYAFSGGLTFEQRCEGAVLSYVLPKRNLMYMLDEVNMQSNQREQHHSVQDLEVENEELKDRLRKIQQEQRILLDKVNGLQLQLNEEVMVADCLESESFNTVSRIYFFPFQKEKLKSLLATKEKQHEESLRTIEALKNNFKYFKSDHLGSGSHFSNRKEDLLLKQDQMYTTDSQCTSPGMPAHMQSRSMLRPLELSLPNQTSYSENEILKKKLETMSHFCESAKQDRLTLQNELAHKVAECKALALECERVKEDSDDQIKQLEDALTDVQKRMYESEGKVKQMQAHFLALKEHLTSEAAAGNQRLTEELKDQLQDMKAKYEGASAEVGKLRHQIKQNEMLVEEFKRDEGKLKEENKRLQKEFSMYEMEREKKGRKATEMESQVRDLLAKLAVSVPTEKFENMKSLLSSEVNEKANKIVVLEREHEKSLSEIRQLKRELENFKAKLAQHVKSEDHEQLKNRLEQKLGEQEKKITELTSRNQTLQKEIEKAYLDNKSLNQQIHTLTTEMKSHYVPLKVSEEMKKAHGVIVADLNKKLLDITQKYSEKKLEMEKLLMENDSLSKNVSHLEAVLVPPEKHEKVMALKSNIVELNKQLSELNKKCGEEQEKIHSLQAENTNLKKAMNLQYVPVKAHEEVKRALSSTLDKTNRELLDTKKKLEDINQELAKIKGENEILKRSLENTQNQIKAEYLSLKEHEEKMSTVSQNMKKMQDDSAEVLAKYKKGQEEIVTLHAEIEAQKKELDTIQECIKLKYAPIVSFEECERKFKASEKELKEQLSEQTHKYNVREEETKKCKQENDKLREEIFTLQKDLEDKNVLVENSHEMEKALSRKIEELNKQLKDQLQKYTEVRNEKEKLLEENTKHTSEILAAQTLMQKQHVPLQQVEALKKSLNGTIENLKEELKNKQRCYEREQQTVTKLQQMLENQKNSSVPLAEHLQIKEAFEKEVGIIKASLREKEAESQNKTEEVSKLQSEVQNTKQALKNLETREVVDLSKYKATKSDLETQISSLNEKLANLNRKYEEVCEEVSHAQKKGLYAKDGKELLHFSIEQEIKDQQERCDKSLSTITELQRRIQESAQQIEAKDNKITELLNDVERLKQALNGLSQLTYGSGSPSKRQSQLIDTLQHQLQSLHQQLADADRQHQEVIAIYRTHLLSAAQGHMDEDVQAALLQIIQMRQGLVC